MKETFPKRTCAVSAMRRYLDDAGYVEVDTPVLQAIPGGARPSPSSRTTTRWTCPTTCASRTSST